MPDCGTYIVPFEAQLGPKYGPFNCTAVAAARALTKARCGHVITSGPTIRGYSTEPVPDPKSPGLNLAQVSSVIEDVYHVGTSVFTGSRAIPWAEYERRRDAGQPMVIQVSYAPIAQTGFDAGHGFLGGHALFEDNNGTYDSLADGRTRGSWTAWKFDGRLYRRDVIRRAAEELAIASDAKGHVIRRAGTDNVWCMALPDVVPTYQVTIKPAKGQRKAKFLRYIVAGGRIVGTRGDTTGGFTAKAHIRLLPYPAKGSQRYLLRIIEGSRAGTYVGIQYGDAL